MPGVSPIHRPATALVFAIISKSIERTGILRAQKTVETALSRDVSTADFAWLCLAPESSPFIITKEIQT